MSKFKVGDKVRVLSDSDKRVEPGTEGVVSYVPAYSEIMNVEFDDRESCFYPEELELVTEELELVTEDPKPPAQDDTQTARSVLREIATDPLADRMVRIAAAEALLRADRGLL